MRSESAVLGAHVAHFKTFPTCCQVHMYEHKWGAALAVGHARRLQTPRDQLHVTPLEGPAWSCTESTIHVSSSASFSWVSRRRAPATGAEPPPRAHRERLGACALGDGVRRVEGDAQARGREAVGRQLRTGRRLERERAWRGCAARRVRSVRRGRLVCDLCRRMVGTVESVSVVVRYRLSKRYRSRSVEARTWTNGNRRDADSAS